MSIQRAFNSGTKRTHESVLNRSIAVFEEDRIKFNTDGSMLQSAILDDIPLERNATNLVGI